MAAPALVAPDSFKGTFTAIEVAGAIAAGLRSAGVDAEALPVADGGEGTMEVLVGALGGDVRSATVSDPLMRPVAASYALLADGRTALVEAAQASGLWRIDPGAREAWEASTHGTGELIAAAVRDGAEEVILAVGGSASTDGGLGALEALEQAGAEPALQVLCDVRTSWEDAARVFGPQKGADPRTVRRLERRLGELAERAPRDPRGVPMTGAAGGLAGGLWSHRGASLLPGAPYVLDRLRFDPRMRSSRFVVTGEGRLDGQSLAGKVVGEVATRCRGAGVPCHAVVGENRLEPFHIRILDLASVTEARTPEELERAGQDLLG